MKTTYIAPDGTLNTERRQDRPVDLKRLALITFVKRVLFFVIFVIGLWLFSGCAKPEIVYQTVYQDVYVPVKCDISVPVKPEPNDSAALMAVDLIEYAEALRWALTACTE